MKKARRIFAAASEMTEAAHLKKVNKFFKSLARNKNAQYFCSRFGNEAQNKNLITAKILAVLR